MTDDDLQYLLKANHNPDIEQLSWWIYPMYPEELKEFYENEMKDWSMCFIIEEKKTGEILWEVGIHEIRQGDRTGEVSVTIFELKNHWKWYGWDALDVIINYAFTYLSLRKLIAWIYSPNIASINLFEKKGFECNWKHKAHRMYRWKYEDMLLYEKFRDSEYSNTLWKDK